MKNESVIPRQRPRDDRLLYFVGIPMGLTGGGQFTLILLTLDAIALSVAVRDYITQA